MKRISLQQRRQLSSVPFFHFCDHIGWPVYLAHELQQGSGTAESRPPRGLPILRSKLALAGPIVVTTSAAEFKILPSGLVQATLLKDGKRLSLDRS